MCCLTAAAALCYFLAMDISAPPLPQSSAVNTAGHLEVSGCDVVEMAAEYGTPLFIYDEQQIRNNCRAYMQAFSSRADDFEVVYASKAFTCVAMCRLISEEGLSIDVASGGELYTALSSRLSPERIVVHGNANTRDELEGYVRSEVGHVVIDSLDELEVLDQVAAELGRVQPVLIRITPGIEAHTHDFIQTGKLDSKFGLCLAEGVAMESIGRAIAAEHLRLDGFHIHIGSQIFSLDPYDKAIALVVELAADCKRVFDFDCRVLDVGGGLGVSYAPDDDPASIEDFAERIVASIKKEVGAAGLPLPRIAVEPGRSIVANAGLTAYTVQAVKTVPGVRTFVAVDGGMSDNLRPMLYGASYQALLANRPEDAESGIYTVAGKHCESGDLLVKDTPLPEPRRGDVLVTPATGAYGYSMASNYNGQPRPAVIFVKDGAARVVIRRESYEDLVQLHERPE